MGAFIDLTGEKFGLILVLNKSHVHNKRVMWDCKCDCGKTLKIIGGALRSGNTKSCGCVGIMRMRNLKLKHGMHGTKEYRCWRKMIERCTVPSTKQFEDYGGRGILVCEEWKEFINFFTDMGTKPSDKHSIERVNNDLGYFKGNCKWATREEQSNNKRNNRFITYNGETKTLTEWAKYLKVPVSTLYCALKNKPFEVLHHKYTWQKS